MDDLQLQLDQFEDGTILHTVFLLCSNSQGVRKAVFFIAYIERPGYGTYLGLFHQALTWLTAQMPSDLQISHRVWTFPEEAQQ